MYEPIWSQPTVGEELTASIASGAHHEKYINAIALDRHACMQSVCVGHLLREITRCTAEVIRKGAQVTCKVTSELSRPQSPVGRIGSREIPIEVTVCMDQSQTNEQTLRDYEKLVTLYYKDRQEVLLLSPVTGGVTRTDLGLQAAENELTSSRSRDNVAKVAILLTDNRSTDPAATRAAATNIRNRGIEVFVIGIGPNVNVMELNEIATDLDSDHVQLASSFSMSVLGMLTDTLSNRTCVGKQLFCYMYVCINISS